VTKRERVRRALERRAVDRVPASFWLHFPAHIGKGDAAVRAHLDFYRDTDVDFLKIMNEHPYELGFAVQDPRDWLQARPAPVSAPFFQAQLDEIKRIVDALRGECLIVTTIRSPIQAYGNGTDTGGRLMTEHLRVDPAAVGVAMRAIAESLAEFATACVDAGADGIYYSAKGGEVDRLHADVFREFVAPHDRTVLAAVRGHGTFNVLHVCGANVLLEEYRDVPSHAVNWAVTKNALSLQDGAAFFDRTVIGGMDNRGVLVDGSDDEIRAAAHAVLEGFEGDGIMLGADCTVPTDVDLRRLRVAVEATAR
jgi:uroporphyrinogen decarboxylase